MDAAAVRRTFRVRGIVQGVGFRPFVYGFATRLGLTGSVLNDAGGVVVEVEGPADAIERFATGLEADAPPLAVIHEIEATDVEPKGSPTFVIDESQDAGDRLAAISPDVGTCVACFSEVTDPTDRRYGYAFTNCTDCGPRFTIALDVPYDRPNTTMRDFEMCEACRQEYEDPADRRFHAQPIACPDCGPQLSFDGPDDPLDTAAARLREGAILAVKGLGGYHLACDASDEAAVAELRRRKAREEKPFAIMVPSLEWACRIAEATPEQTAMLTSRRRPIVLVRRREGPYVAASVAPGNRDLGLMLPNTPLHRMLLEGVGRPIVLTSGNVSDEPIAHHDDDARERLGPIADVFLTHDRPIHVRCDDSVVRVVDGREYPIRRSRGYAPEPVFVDPPFARPVLAAGPELKHTFCLGTADRAIVSHHIGDLENWEAMRSFLCGVEHFTRVFDVTPEVVAYDLHPEYLSTKWALEREGVELVGVQHHHAHIASCLADNGRTDRVIGLALDGTGYGTDGTIWGCEVLVCDLVSFERVGHLRTVPMPGGAAAIREPWRMAAVYLDAAGAADLAVPFAERTREWWGPILQMAAKGINAPVTSSAGRLFDAVAALCGVRDTVSYEGQAAIELEQLAAPDETDAYPCLVADGLIDGVALVAAAAEDLVEGRDAAEVAAAFHNGFGDALVRACFAAREDTGLGTVALSGGAFQNLLLLERVRTGLRNDGFEVLVHRRVPPNDGGISLGQAVVANAVSGG